MRPLLIDGMQGLGDNLYQRALLREVVKTQDAYLYTSWPQLYRDIGVHCLRPGVKLRTQNKNIAATPEHFWENAPVNTPLRKWHYVNRGGSILQSLAEDLSIPLPDRIDMSGPIFDSLVITGQPYVVVRPVTLRSEWRADSRNPLPEYIAQAATEAKARGATVVSIADLADGVEWVLSPLPYADIVFHKGELGIESLMMLIAGASSVIGGVGWLLPAALAYRKRMLLIYGGWGAHNGPGRILDKRVDSSMITQAIPDNFCMCGQRDHCCDKRISGFEEILNAFPFV